MGSYHRNEEDDEALKEMESESPLQTFVGLETENTTEVAQAEAEQCQEFCPSSDNQWHLQPQRTSPVLRANPKTLTEGSRRQKGYFKFGRSFWRTRARKKSLRRAERRQVPVKTPCSSVACLSAQRSEVSCCSDIYTSAGGSPKLNSHPESVYIYAESIKGFISCSSVSQDWVSLLIHTEVQKSSASMRDPRAEIAEMSSSIEALYGSDSSCGSESTRGDSDLDSSCVNADWEQSFDSDSDSNSFAEAQWGSASSCSDSAASGYITDDNLESSFSNTEQHDGSASCNHFEAGHSDSEVGQVESEDCGLAVSHFEVEHHDWPASHYKPSHNLPVGYFETGHCGSPLGHFEANGCDPLVGHFEAGHNLPTEHFEFVFCGSLDGHFEAGHHNFPVEYFEGEHRDSPIGHLEAKPCASPVGGHFEAGHCESSVGHFEAGHHDSPDSLFEAGHCKSPVGHFDADTDDLYNAVPESADAVWYSIQEQNNLCQLVEYPELTWRQFRGVVTHPDRYHVAPFFHEMMKATAQDRNQEEVKINKGFLFHPQRFLQAKNSQYREGREYSMLRHVQNGSYGDVFSVRDKQTGFTCAAKRIPLSSFSWEEVGTWSRLDSTRVLQLYGAIREGLNVVLFMDLKTGSLAQLLKAKGHFPEVLALYYHRQVLQALEHLHSRNVIHLDVKVDNVLLSQDKKECFLCDFGLSEMLDQTGYSTKTFRGTGLRGTESHMSPEVARGDPRSDKADVWSSCCMLLHMLSGHQPWTRYYTHPLCLKIVSEPAPLWEIPAECEPLTRDIISGGLVKEPRERDSARQLLEKSVRALQTGGRVDPVKSAMCKMPRPQISPLISSHNVLPKQPAVSSSAIPNRKELSASKIQWVSGWRHRAAKDDGTESEHTYEDTDGGTDETGSWMERYWGLNSEDENDTDGETRRSSEERWIARALVGEEQEQSDEEVESDLGSLRELGSEEELEPFRRLQILCGPKWQHSEDEWSETEEEFAASMISLNLRDPNSRLTLACHRSVCASDAEHTNKGSDLLDDLSSGVFSSYSSLPDERSFNVDWSVSTNQPPSCSFEGLGVDIWVEDVNGDTFRIRERLKVKLGHVAIGISAQISMRMFSLATLDGKLVSPDTEVLESRMWLLCLPAPDNSTCWTWRIRDGKLETQEADWAQSDTCSTLGV